MTELTLVEKLFAGLDFPAWTLVALVYAFIGWFYESTIFSLCEQGKFMDRGVLGMPEDKWTAGKIRDRTGVPGSCRLSLFSGIFPGYCFLCLQIHRMLS